MKRPLRTLLGLAVVLAVTPGCGGGGGGGGGGPVVPQPGITLTPASASSPAIVLATGAATTSSILDLEIRAASVSDLYGLAFDLTYPSGQLRFDSFAEGNFLASPGTPTSLQVARDGNGRLVVGFTRLGAAAGVSGSGTLVVLRFTAIGAGDGAFQFSRNRSFGASGAAQTGVNWAGASVRVVL